MRSKEKLRQFATILGLLYILLLDPAIVISAPVTVEESNYGVEEGCYYMLDVYKNGEQIRTKEPCLNCTCTNSMLMCYLQTCPFSKPIGSECSIERVHGQCCPIIKCPEVPVMITEASPFVGAGRPSSTALTHSISTSTVIALQQPEEGCYIDGTYYVEGTQVPLSGNDPCDLCYCIHNATRCVKQRCVLEIPGCVPQYRDGACCPSAYDCDETVTFRPPSTTSTTTTTTTVLPATGCYVDDVYYYDGAVVNTGGSCDHCYCINGELVCAVQDCKIHMDNCTPVFGKDQCCPERFDCPVTETPSVLTESTSVSLKEDDDHSSSFLNGNELATNKDEEVGYGNETELPVIEDNRNSTVSVDSQSQESTSSVTEGLAKEFHVTTDEPSTNGSYEVTTEVDTATQKVLLDSGVSDEAGGERTPQPEISHITSSEETAKTTNVNILNDKEHESTSSSIAETAETTDSTVKGLHSVDSKVHFSTVSVNHRIELTTELEPIYSSSESPLNGDSDDSVSVTMEHKLEISNHSLSIPGNASEIGYQEETITLYPEIDDEGSNVLATDSVTSHVITSLPTTASEGHSQESDSYSTPSAKVSLDVVTSSENDVVVTASEPAVAAIAEFTTPSVLKYDQTAFAEQTDKPILNDEERQTHSLVPLQDATTSDVGTTEELQTFIPVEKETTIDAQRSTSLPYIPLEHDKDKEITAAPEPEKGSLEPESSSSLPKVEIGSEAPQDLDDSTSEKKHPNTESSTIKDLEGIPGEGDCYQDGVTYKDGQPITSKNVCDVNCTCSSSVIYCHKLICQVPEAAKNLACAKTFDSGRCCPIYVCNESRNASDRPISSGSLVTEETFATTVKLPVIFTTESYGEDVSLPSKDQVVTEEQTSSSPSVHGTSKVPSDFIKPLSTVSSVENEVTESVQEISTVQENDAEKSTESPSESLAKDEVATTILSVDVPHYSESSTLSKDAEVNVQHSTVADHTTSKNVISLVTKVSEDQSVKVVDNEQDVVNKTSVNELLPTTENPGNALDNVQTVNKTETYETHSTTSSSVDHEIITSATSTSNHIDGYATSKLHSEATTSTPEVSSDASTFISTTLSPFSLQHRNETAIKESDGSNVDADREEATEYTERLDEVSGKTTSFVQDDDDGGASTKIPITESPEKQTTIYEVYGNDHSTTATHLSVTVKILIPDQNSTTVAAQDVTQPTGRFNDDIGASEVTAIDVHSKDESTQHPSTDKSYSLDFAPTSENFEEPHSTLPSTEKPPLHDSIPISTVHSVQVDNSQASTEEPTTADITDTSTEGPVKGHPKPLSTEEPLHVDASSTPTEEHEKDDSDLLSTEETLQVDKKPASTEEAVKVDSEIDPTEEPYQIDTRPQSTEEPVKAASKPLSTEELLHINKQKESNDELEKVDSKPLHTEDPLQDDITPAPTEETAVSSKPLSTEEPLQVNVKPVSTEESVIADSQPLYTEEPIKVDPRPESTEEPVKADSRPLSTEKHLQIDARPESTEEPIEDVSKPLPTEESVHVDDITESTEEPVKTYSKPLSTNEPVQVDTRPESTEESVNPDSKPLPTEQPPQVDEGLESTEEPKKDVSKPLPTEESVHVGAITESTEESVKADSKPLSTEEPPQVDERPESTEEPAKDVSKPLPTEESVNVDAITESTEEPVRTYSKPLSTEEPVQVDTRPESTEESVKADSKPLSTEEPVQVDTRPESTEESVKADSKPLSTEEPVQVDTRPESTEESVKADSKPLSTEEPPQVDERLESTEEPAKDVSKPVPTEESVHVDAITESTEEPVKPTYSKPLSTEEPLQVDTRLQSTEESVKADFKPLSTELLQVDERPDSSEEADSKPLPTEESIHVDIRLDSTEEPVKTYSHPLSTEISIQFDARPESTEDTVKAYSKPLPTEESVLVDTKPESTEEPLKADSKPLSTEEPLQYDERPESTEDPVKVDSKPLSTDEPLQVDARPEYTEEPVIAHSKPLATEGSLQLDARPESTEEPVKVDSKPLSTDEPLQAAPLRPECTEEPVKAYSKTLSSEAPLLVEASPVYTEEAVKVDSQPLFTEEPPQDDATSASATLSSSQHSILEDTKPLSSEKPLYIDSELPSHEDPHQIISKPQSSATPLDTDGLPLSSVGPSLSIDSLSSSEKPYNVDVSSPSSERPLVDQPSFVDDIFSVKQPSSEPSFLVNTSRPSSSEAPAVQDVKNEQTTALFFDLVTEEPFHVEQNHTSTSLPFSEPLLDEHAVDKTESHVIITTVVPGEMADPAGSSEITEQTRPPIHLTTKSSITILENATFTTVRRTSEVPEVQGLLDPISTVAGVPLSVETGDLATTYSLVNISTVEKESTTLRSAINVTDRPLSIPELESDDHRVIFTSSSLSTPSISGTSVPSTVSSVTPQTLKTTPQPIEEEYTEEYFPEFGIPVTSENITLPAGACVYDSRVYGSAQQIPRNDPCEFCFCFRGEIICLQQSCPPPIKDCHEEPIHGYCCPRYECPITAVTLNLTNVRTPYPLAASRLRTVRALTQSQVVVCEFRNKFYSRGEVIAPASGPCMDCMCGDTGVMKCNPKKCQLSPFWQSFPGFKRLLKPHQTRDGRNTY